MLVVTRKAPCKRSWSGLYAMCSAGRHIRGPCEGATVVVQQDNAGPHIEEAYSLWIHEQFEMLGWMYEPQAPQGSENVVCCLDYKRHPSTLTIYLIVITSA